MANRSTRHRRQRPNRAKTGRGPAPGRTRTSTRSRTGDGRAVLCQLLICLAVVTGLTTRHLEATAQSRPFGPDRSILVAVTTALDHQAQLLGLDQPDRLADRALGHQPASHPQDAPEPTLHSELALRSEATLRPDQTPRADSTATADPAVAEVPSTVPSLAAMIVGPTAIEPVGPLIPVVLVVPVVPTVAPYDGSPGSLQPEPGASMADHDPPELADHPVESSPTYPTGTTAPVPTGTTTAPSPSPASSVAVDPEHKLRLWSGGDSMGQYVGNQLRAPLSDRDLTDVELDYHISTGLARPDYYDWPARIHQVMTRPQPPDALVLMIGGNDNQPMRRDGAVLAVGSPEWLSEYRARVAGIMDDTGNGHSHLYWIGLPPMRSHDRDTLTRGMDAVVAEEAAIRPWVTHLDIASTFAGPDGGFASRIVGPDGVDRVARAPDGVHITSSGSDWVATRVWAEVAAHWHLDHRPGPATGAIPEPGAGPVPAAPAAPQPEVRSFPNPSRRYGPN